MTETEQNEYLWRRPGSPTMAEKRAADPLDRLNQIRDERYGARRPQQVHVPLHTRLWLEIRRRFWGWVDRRYARLIEAADYSVRKPGDASGIENLDTELQALRGKRDDQGRLP